MEPWAQRLMQKINREFNAKVNNAMALWCGKGLVAMFDFGFLCRHGIIYGACDDCMASASSPKVACPWAKTEAHRGPKVCPACKGTGFVEELA